MRTFGLCANVLTNHGLTWFGIWKRGEQGIPAGEHVHTHAKDGRRVSTVARVVDGPHIKACELRLGGGCVANTIVTGIVLQSVLIH